MESNRLVTILGAGFIGRYIIKHLDYGVVQDMERINPGALDKLCILYTLDQQLEKENYGRTQRKTKRKYRTFNW